jgi:hypothetical protein
MVIVFCICLLTNSNQDLKDKDSEVRRQTAIIQSEKDLKDAEAKLTRYQKSAVNSITAAKGMTVKNGQIVFRSVKERNEAIEAQKLLVADAQKALEEYKGGKVPPALPPTFSVLELPLKTGHIGYLIKDAPVVKVWTILGKDAMVAEASIWRSSPGAMDIERIGLIFRGVSTMDVTDNDFVRMPQLFEVKGTENYAGSTMFVLTPIDPKDAAKKVAGK